MAQPFFERTVLLALIRQLVGDGPFSGDGTLLKARALPARDGSDGDDFNGQKRSNEAHVSATSPLRCGSAWLCDHHTASDEGLRRELAGL